MTAKDLVTKFKNKIFSEVLLHYSTIDISLDYIPFPIGVYIIPDNTRNEIASLKVLGAMVEAHMMEIPVNAILVKINQSPGAVPE